jgi:hypothetical protein
LIPPWAAASADVPLSAMPAAAIAATIVFTMCTLRELSYSVSDRFNLPKRPLMP